MWNNSNTTFGANPNTNAGTGMFANTNQPMMAFGANQQNISGLNTTFGTNNTNNPTNQYNLYGSRETIEHITKYISSNAANNYFELPIKNEYNDQRYRDLSPQMKEFLLKIEEKTQKTVSMMTGCQQNLEKLKEISNLKDSLIFQSLELQSLKFRISSLIIKIDEDEQNELQLSQEYATIYNNFLLQKENKLPTITEDALIAYYMKMESHLQKIKQTVHLVGELLKVYDVKNSDENNILLSRLLEQILIRMANIFTSQKQCKERIDSIKLIVIELLMNSTGNNSQAVESMINGILNQTHSSTFNMILGVK